MRNKLNGRLKAMFSGYLANCFVF